MSGNDHQRCQFCGLHDLGDRRDTYFQPGGWNIHTAQTVTISTSTTGDSIRFTTDGSTPSSTVGTLYSGPILVRQQQDDQSDWVHERHDHQRCQFCGLHDLGDRRDNLLSARRVEHTPPRKR